MLWLNIESQNCKGTRGHQQVFAALLGWGVGTIPLFICDLEHSLLRVKKKNTLWVSFPYPENVRLYLQAAVLASVTIFPSLSLEHAKGWFQAVYAVFWVEPSLLSLFLPPSSVASKSFFVMCHASKPLASSVFRVCLCFILQVPHVISLFLSSPCPVRFWTFLHDWVCSVLSFSCSRVLIFCFLFPLGSLCHL